MNKQIFDYTPNPDRYNKSKMQYRRCGKSGILLPEIALGFWQNFGAKSDYVTCREMVHYAFDQGIVHFDLANNYGLPYGSAEENFGRMMKDSFQPYRHELFIATKAGHDMWQGPYGDWGSRKYLMNSLDQSLQRMNLDYVDIFYSHRYDPNTPLEETLQTLIDIVKQGKSLYVGISKYPLEAAKFAFEYLKARDVKCLAYQGRYNMLTRDVEKEGIIDLCNKEGVGFVPFSPLAQGLLSNKYVNGDIPTDSRMSENRTLQQKNISEDTMSKIQKLHQLALERGYSLSQLALTWLLSDKRTASVVVGARTKEQLAQSLSAIELEHLSQTELLEINKILLTED